MNEELNVIKNQLKKEMGIQETSRKRGNQESSSTPVKKAKVSFFLLKKINFIRICLVPYLIKTCAEFLERYHLS